MCCRPDGRGFEYQQRRKNFSGEPGQCSSYNECAVGRTGGGSNTSRGVRIFLGSQDSVALTTNVLRGEGQGFESRDEDFSWAHRNSYLLGTGILSRG